jgi:threonine dehydratase
MSMSPQSIPGILQVREAHLRISSFIHRTPVMSSAALDAHVGSKLFFKCENFQKVGAFKARGAHNAVFSLSDADAHRGVVTHSSGNHAAALALAARNRGIPAYIVMPANAPEVKKRSVARYGGRISYCESTLQARESTAARLVSETRGAFIHPYDDVNVIAGQGTAALEFLQDIPDLDAIIAPVGGGGHLSGVAIAVKGINPQLRVYGAEPLGADDAARSFTEGRLIPQLDPKTIADGLRTSLSELTFGIIRSHVDRIFTVSEPEIVGAMRLVWETTKIVIEPSAAVPVAAVLARPPELRNQRVGIILTGGNVDLDHLPWINKA